MKSLRLAPLALVLFAACSVGPQPSVSVTTSSPAWQHYFKVTYDVEERGGHRKISGYVVNEYGEAMRNVRLLVQALDANDQVVSQKLVWVPRVLPGFGRSYFEVAGLPPAKDYRVTVWSFDRIDGGGSRWP